MAGRFFEEGTGLPQEVARGLVFSVTPGQITRVMEDGHFPPTIPDRKSKPPHLKEM